MKDLYKSRKGNGTLQIEMESLKSDNERLLALLKDTNTQIARMLIFSSRQQQRRSKAPTDW